MVELTGVQQAGNVRVDQARQDTAFPAKAVHARFAAARLYDFQGDPGGRSVVVADTQVDRPHATAAQHAVNAIGSGEQRGLGVRTPTGDGFVSSDPVGRFGRYR